MLAHRILFDETTIAARVNTLAKAICEDLPTSTPTVIGLLTGSFVFLADLMRACARLGVEPVVDFMAITHYGRDTRSPGKVEVRKDIAVDVHGQSVLLIDDILDSGLTLEEARNRLLARGPKWLRTCVLLGKPARRVVNIQADYVGFQVPDVWIIGYGLDYAGEGRALPYVAAVQERARQD